MQRLKRLKREYRTFLSTDIIVGFPTETKEDFEETLDVLRKVEYDNIFSFIYSRREGTPAAKLDFVTYRRRNTREFQQAFGSTE